MACCIACSCRLVLCYRRFASAILHLHLWKHHTQMSQHTETNPRCVSTGKVHLHKNKHYSFLAGNVEVALTDKAREEQQRHALGSAAAQPAGRPAAWSTAAPPCSSKQMSNSGDIPEAWHVHSSQDGLQLGPRSRHTCSSKRMGNSRDMPEAWQVHSMQGVLQLGPRLRLTCSSKQISNSRDMPEARQVHDL